MMIRFYFDRFTHDLYMKQATASVPLSRCNCDDIWVIWDRV